MPTNPSDALRAEVVERLDPHSSGGARTALAGVIDEEALQDQKYHQVLDTVDDRLSRARFSLISMLVSGIYFGLLVGAWLLDFSSWGRISLWGAPVGLVMTYGIYATHQTAMEIRRLSEARAFLVLLAERAPSKGKSASP